MSNLNVKHYLSIYQVRKEMQEEGITNPSSEVKKFTRDFVEKLSELPLEEKINIIDYCFFDSKGNLIAKFPH